MSTRALTAARLPLQLVALLIAMDLALRIVMQGAPAPSINTVVTATPPRESSTGSQAGQDARILLGTAPSVAETRPLVRKKITAAHAAASTEAFLPAMSLIGTAVGPGASAAWAIIDGKQRTLRRGDRVGAWKLTQILDDRVIIESGGTRRTVVLGAPADRPAVRTHQPVPSSKEVRIVIPRTDWERALRDPDRFKRMRIIPASGGVQVAVVGDKTFLSLLQVMQGDVIVSVNAVPANVDHFDDMQRILAHEDHIVVRLERGSQARVHNTEIR